jgi:hypothetical protein
MVLSLLSFAYAISQAGETESVGSGEFQMNLPTVTVFQEIESLLYGIFGAIMWGVAGTCEIVLQLLSRNTAQDEPVRAKPQLRATLDLPTQLIAPFEPELSSSSDSVSSSNRPSSMPDRQNKKVEYSDGKLRIMCQECGRVIVGGADWAGRRGACPKCKAPITFPTT